MFDRSNHLRNPEMNSFLHPMLRPLVILTFLFGVLIPCTMTAAGECTNWQTSHPSWIWCDDFEDGSTLPSKYYDFTQQGGSPVLSSGNGLAGSMGVRFIFGSGATGAGYFKRTFGRNPANCQSNCSTDFGEIYARIYSRTQAGWQTTGQAKFERITSFVDSNWSQSMIAHLWSADPPSSADLQLDPASGVSGGTVVTSGWNDVAHFNWLGASRGPTGIFAPANANTWYCVETHVKLNTPGQSDGVFEFWVNGHLEARQTNLNWVGTYAAYKMNVFSIESYIGDGSPRAQERYLDNMVISTQPIGCLADSSPLAPTGLQVL
jgi:hypothetical protein